MLAALVVGCLVAACGSASSSSTTSGTTTAASAAASGAGGAGGGASSSQRTALAACLKQHGVTLPARPAGTPGGAPGGAAGGAPGGAPPSGGTGPGTTGTGTTGTGTTGTGTTGTSTTPRRGFFGSGGFANNPKLRAAFQACGAKFGFGARGRGFRGRLSHTAITKYVTCVRQHGYNLPNPNFSGKGPVFPANIQNNAKFQAASKACQSLLVPARPSGSGAGSGTSTTSGA
jgi:hypothetical protein